jgi:hypothetical protein
MFRISNTAIFISGFGIIWIFEANQIIGGNEPVLRHAIGLNSSMIDNALGRLDKIDPPGTKIYTMP